MAQTIQTAGQTAKVAASAPTVGPVSQAALPRFASGQLKGISPSKGMSALGQQQAISAVKMKGIATAPVTATTAPATVPIQKKTMLQRGQEMQGYADKIAKETAPHIDEFMRGSGEIARDIGKDIKTGTRYAGSSIYKFGELSYKVAGQGTPYVKGFLHSVNSSMPYKLVFLFLFVTVFYNVIYRICVFFGIDVVLLNMYMGWVSFLLVLFTFLPYEYGNVLDTPE